MTDLQFRTKPATVGSIVAQADSDSSDCRFEVHGLVNAETISREVDAFTVCSLKAA